jgi:hypothetical protein
MNDIMFMFSICSIHGCEELVWLQPGVHSSCASQFLCVRDMSTRFRFARTAAPFDAAAPEKMRAQKNYSDSS